MEQKTQDLGLVVGANLKSLQKKNGKTQEDLAEDLFVNVRTIRRWIKSGVHDIRDIQHIADFFNVDMAVLFV